MSGFRPNVALVLRNSEGRILICERTDFPGSWQFPQGGIKSGESPLQALEREVMEELGIPPERYAVKASYGPYRYLFGPGIRKNEFLGQEQTCFLAETTKHFPQRWSLDVPNKEFCSTRWIDPVQFDLGWLHRMKWDVYCSLFSEAFGILLPKPEVQDKG